MAILDDPRFRYQDRVKSATTGFNLDVDDVEKRWQQFQKKQQKQEKKSTQAIDQGLNRGMSWEDIAKQTGIPLTEVQSYSQRTRPEYGIAKQPSLLQRAGGAAKAVGQGIAQSYDILSKGTAEVLGGSAQARANEAQARADQASTDLIRRATQQLQDPNVPAERKARLREAIKKVSGTTIEAFGTQQARLKEIQERTDPVRGAAAVGSIGFDVLTAGTIGGAAKAGAAGLGRRVASGAAQGAVSGGLGAVETQGRDVSARDIARGAAAGAVIGGGLTASAAGVSRALSRRGQGAALAQDVAGTPKTAKVAELTSYEGAPDRAAVDAYKARIQAGETPEPIIVKKDSTGALGIEDGKHRYQAYKELGYEDVPIIDASTPVSPKQLTQTLTATAKNPEAVAKRTGVQTSRVKQFYDSAQKEMISDIEANGITNVGQRQAVADTYKTAIDRGPLNLTSVKVGDKIDAVDVVRARMTMETYLDDAQKAIKSGDAKAIAASKDELEKALNGYKVLTGEAGRATQIQSTFDNKAVQAFEAIADYQKTIADGAVPTRGQIKQMDNILEEAAADAQLTRADMLKQGLYAGDTSLVRKLEEYATAAKLTSPTTHVRNIIGNTLTFGQRAIEQGVATAIGAARGRTSIRAITKGLGTRSGYKEATAKFMGIMNDAVRLRQTPTSMAASEGYKQAIGGRLGEAIRIPFKLLEATDEFGKAVLRDSRLHQEAFDLAYKEGARGDALTSRVAELVQNPTKKMMADAQKDALEFTFQKDLGKVGKNFQNIVSTIPGGKFFVPFIKTPTNIVKFQLQRSIAGAPGQLVQGIAKKGTREGDEAIAKALTGTMFSLGTYNWVRDNADRITGAAPTAQSDRDAFYAEGKQPYSIKIGDKWVSYQSFQPVGMYLLQAKSLADAIDKNDNKGAANIAAGMAQVAAKGLLELPFVQGMNNIFEALGNPERKAEDFVSSTIKGFVPNALRDVRLYTDEVIRAPKDLKEQIFDMVPGLSNQLSPRRNVLGETVKRKDSPLARSLFRVFGSQEQIPREEFEVLKGVSKNEGYTVENPGRTQRGTKLNKDEYQAYQDAYYQRFGSKLSEAVSAGWFTGLNWEDKRKEIQRMVREAGDETRDDFFGPK